MKKVFELDFYGRKIVVEHGQVAKQADGAVLVRYGDTVVLSTAVVSKSANLLSDFFPLMVLYQEKLYSVGKIPGGFIKREGRPTEAATLASRMIDRPLRPLFPDDFKNEVQIVNTVLSVDQDNSPELTALLGSSIAVSISKIPFNGPVAAVKVGKVNGEYIINPTIEQTEKSEIDLTVAGTKDAINMVEAGAKEASEDDMLEALMFGHEAIKKLIALTIQNYEVGKAYNRFCANLEVSIRHVFTKKEFPKCDQMTEEQYLLKNVVQSFANKLYVEVKFLNKEKLVGSSH